MTEAQWLACTNPGGMLELLRGRASERRLRLASGQFCLSYMAAYPHPTWNELSPTTEAIARHASDSGTRSDEWAVEPASDSLPSVLLHRDAHTAARGTWVALTRLLRSEIFNSRYSLANFNVDVCFGEIEELTDAFNAAQCDLLRDIFGNPFRPVAVDPAWLTDTALSLARNVRVARVQCDADSRGRVARRRLRQRRHPEPLPHGRCPRSRVLGR